MEWNAETATLSQPVRPTRSAARDRSTPRRPVQGDGEPSSPLSVRWEYQQVKVPLDLTVRRSLLGGRSPFERMAHRADEDIAAYLRRLAADGWRPDEAVTFTSLYRRGRVDCRYRGGLMARHEVLGVSVNVKRPSREGASR